MNKIIIITAIFGDKDFLIEQPKFKNVNYVCYTDNKKLKSKIWKIYYENKQPTPRLYAKKFKILTHNYTNAKLILWIDGNLELKKDPIDLLKYLGQKDILVFEHMTRNSIFKESKECIRLGFDKKSINTQIKKIKNSKYPNDFGLSRCSIILKRNNKQTKNMFNEWYKWVNKFSIRDQTSFDYFLWKHKIKFKRVEKSKFYEFFKKRDHLKASSKNETFLLDKIKITLKKVIFKFKRKNKND